jgi:hypothetical protein
VVGNRVASAGAARAGEMRSAMEEAADMLHQCASECAECDYGSGPTGVTADGRKCEGCAPILSIERRLRELSRFGYVRSDDAEGA